MDFFEKTIDETPISTETIPPSVDKKQGALVTAIVRDLTSRKNFEKRLEESEQLNKMLIEFVSTVSHQLRTPLTSIIGAINLILMGKGGELTNKMKHLIDIAHRNGERLALLINDILDIEKIEADKMSFTMETIDVVAFVKQVVENDRVYAEKLQVKLVVDTRSKQPLIITTDKQRLTQVLTNLLSNAVKFSPPKEIVKIKIEKLEEKIRISFIDHGPGIPNEFHDKLFQKFVQINPSNHRQKGTGLGLSIAKTIMDKLGGSIGFKSRLGHGSTFYIELNQDN